MRREVFRFGRLLFAHRSPFGTAVWTMLMMMMMTTFDEASLRSCVAPVFVVDAEAGVYIRADAYNIRTRA